MRCWFGRPTTARVGCTIGDGLAPVTAPRVCTLRAGDGWVETTGEALAPAIGAGVFCTGFGAIFAPGCNPAIGDVFPSVLVIAADPFGVGLAPLTAAGICPGAETIFSPGRCTLPIGDCATPAVGDGLATLVATAGDCTGFDSTFCPG